jgi:hypothetical protein
MARQTTPVAELIADLFVAIEQDDPLGTLEATQALAERVGAHAATSITRALLADHRRPVPVHAIAAESFPPASELGFPLVTCA